MAGYCSHTDTKESVFDHGFFKSGDVGYINDAGFVFLIERMKEMIKVKGYVCAPHIGQQLGIHREHQVLTTPCYRRNQVAPAELEALLLRHPAVTDAAVCGIYLESEATEYPIAYITTGCPVDLHGGIIVDVQQFVDNQVTPYKRLRAGVHILNAIPRK